jgi:hypothetical protein
LVPALRRATEAKKPALAKSTVRLHSVAVLARRWSLRNSATCILARLIACKVNGLSGVVALRHAEAVRISAPGARTLLLHLVAKAAMAFASSGLATPNHARSTASCLNGKNGLDAATLAATVSSSALARWFILRTMEAVNVLH